MRRSTTIIHNSCARARAHCWNIRFLETWILRCNDSKRVYIIDLWKIAYSMMITSPGDVRRAPRINVRRTAAVTGLHSTSAMRPSRAKAITRSYLHTNTHVDTIRYVHVYNGRETFFRATGSRHILYVYTRSRLHTTFQSSAITQDPDQKDFFFFARRFVALIPRNDLYSVEFTPLYTYSAAAARFFTRARLSFSYVIASQPPRL